MSVLVLGMLFLYFVVFFECVFCFGKWMYPVSDTGFLCFGFVFGLGVLVFIFFKNFVFITFSYIWYNFFHTDGLEFSLFYTYGLCFYMSLFFYF